MRWELHSDGSFDIVCNAGALRNAFPGFDHQDIRPVRVQAGDNRLRYELAQGSLELTFVNDAGKLRLGCTLRGCTVAPHWLHPVHTARVEGFSRAFRQGIGFSGPTGIVEFASQKGAWVVESYMLGALVDGDENTLVFGPEHHRDFHFKAQMYNRLFRYNFRNREVDENPAMFEAGMRTERVPLSGDLVLPEIVFCESRGLFDALRAAATRLATAGNVPAARPPCYHYCSCYHYGVHFTTGHLDHVLDGLAKVDPQVRLHTVQIDDWYMTSHGDWLTPRESHYPGGVALAFAKIKAAGREPGVWVAPFMVGCNSELARKHPDWLLRKEDGSLQIHWKNFVGGLGDYEHYVLDTSHPDALEWVRTVFSTFRGMGVKFFKTDFLEWGYRDSAKFRRHTPGRTGAQYFDDVMRTIRGAIGDDSYWLGCITYFAPSVGYMNGMRVSSDIGLSWDHEGAAGNDGVGGGVGNVLDESYATLYMNNVLWQNDPDVVFVRNWHLDFTDDEFRSLAAFAGVLGHSVNTSDEIGDLPPERLAWWRWLRPSDEPWTARLPFYARKFPLRVAVRDYRDANGQAVFALNDTHAPVATVLRIADVTGQESAAVYRWSPKGAELMGTVDRLVIELETHASELLFVSRDGAPPPADLNLGGSRGV